MKRTDKTEKSFDKYLNDIEKFLIQLYGTSKTQFVIEKSKSHYTEIIQSMPFFNSTMYDQLINKTNQKSSNGDD